MVHFVNGKRGNPIVSYVEASLRENKSKGYVDEDFGACQDNLIGFFEDAKRA